LVLSNVVSRIPLANARGSEALILLHAVTTAALLLLSLSPAAVAADEEEKAVLGAIDRFFAILATRDSAAARELLVADGRFHRIVEEAGRRVVVNGRSFGELADQLSSGKGKLLERIWEPKVQVHGPIASVWAPYDFHIDGKFSHCGVDGFQLVKTEAGWKISGLVYTVERTGCKKSPLGPPPGS